MPFKNQGIFSGRRHKGVRRQGYLAQVSDELDREQARPETDYYDRIESAQRLTLNLQEAEKRGNAFQVWYYRVRLYIGHKIFTASMRKLDKVNQLRVRRGANPLKPGRSGRY